MTALDDRACMRLMPQRFFRYREDRLPVLFFALSFALDLLVFWLVDDVRLLPLWTLMGIMHKGWICAWNHHHQHLPIFEVPVLNRLVEVIFGLQTGMTAHSWTLHHTLGHHPNYLDQAKDESRWKDDNGKQMGVLRYTFEVSLTSYTRAWTVSRKYPKHRPVFLGMGFATLAILGVGFAFKPWHTLFVFLLPMAISLLITAWATYTHHSGRPTDNHFEASTNIINRAYNIVTGNLGYHTAHHFRHGVHWSRLPQLHDEIKHLIPEDAYMEAGFPFGVNAPVEPPASLDLDPAE